MKSFVLQKEALKYLLLQRTDYRSTIGILFQIVNLRWLYERYLSSAIEVFRINTISRLYYQDMIDLLRVIESVLPQIKSPRVMDIGCGLGGICVLINQYYESKKTTFCLVDKNEMSEKVYYFFEDRAAAYNSFGVTVGFLNDNGVSADQLIAIDLNNALFPHGESFDLITSFISWGYHYPIDTYLEDVYQLLAEDGVLIVDLRDGTEGFARLKAKFPFIRILEKSRGHTKVAAWKREKSISRLLKNSRFGDQKDLSTGSG